MMGLSWNYANRDPRQIICVCLALAMVPYMFLPGKPEAHEGPRYACYPPQTTTQAALFINQQCCTTVLIGGEHE